MDRVPAMNDATRTFSPSIGRVSPPLDRRSFVRKTGLAALGTVLVPGCASRSSEPGLLRPGSRFAKVEVSPDRVIRVVVGLRPYRQAGFVVRAEQFDEKTVIHNYGHGGRGVSLSWGTAHLAADEALRTVHRQCAVIGCGAVGLATARLLQRRGFDVTIYARDLPPDTTSNAALAMWDEAGLPEDAGLELREQYHRATRLSYRYFQGLVGDRYGVRWLANYSPLKYSPDLSPAEASAGFYPGFKVLSKGEHPFGPIEVARWFKMLIEPPVYLEALIQDFLQAGGRIVVREFHDVPSLLSLPERLVVNCTGLGARELFGDKGLIPAKGQLVVLLPQPDVDYIVDIVGDMCPRRDGVLLGGTWERDVWSLEPNHQAVERILARQAEFFARMI